MNSSQTPFQEISVQELDAKGKAGSDYILIDVRQPEEYEEGHIPGSKLIPLGELPAAASSLDPKQDFVLSCRSGARSAKACEFLAQQGFTKLSNLEGGYLSWSEVHSKD